MLWYCLCVVNDIAFNDEVMANTVDGYAFVEVIIEYNKQWVVIGRLGDKRECKNNGIDNPHDDQIINT